jgi:hypothetical protein
VQAPLSCQQQGCWHTTYHITRQQHACKAQHPGWTLHPGTNNKYFRLPECWQPSAACCFCLTVLRGSPMELAPAGSRSKIFGLTHCRSKHCYRMTCNSATNGTRGLTGDSRRQQCLNMHAFTHSMRISGYFETRPHRLTTAEPGAKNQAYRHHIEPACQMAQHQQSVGSTVQ